MHGTGTMQIIDDGDLDFRAPQLSSYMAPITSNVARRAREDERASDQIRNVYFTSDLVN